MTAAVVGGAFLSASLQVLFDRLASREVVDFIRTRKLNDGMLKKLKIKLLSANAVLDDAEEKQIRNRAVREWLDELKATIYDAEDLVDEINTEALRCKLEGESGSGSSQVLNLISTRFAAFNEKVDYKMEEILDGLEFILEQKEFLGLKEGIRRISRPQRLPATSLVEESGVYGRDADKIAIIKLLLSDEHRSSKVSVIPIVGMGGIGKTTLAQLIYNDDHVKKHFEIKTWVCVSDEFDVIRITRMILEAVTGQKCDSNDLNKLQVKLKDMLTGKKFLFVLDDVWNENYMYWDILKSSFESGACGSKIIVTTRSEDVANMMQNVPYHNLQTISEEDCWKLFVKHAFANRELSSHPDLEGIGRQIVRKCKGLPLAVKSLGGLLRSESHPQKWENILKNDIWELPTKENNILPALWLSYYNLPSHLKRCFAYCSIFPKGYVFTKEMSILLWMSENLLEPHKRKTTEEVGEEYFTDLLSRSLFQRHEYLGFTMHDLVNDLAKFVSGEFFLRLDENYSHLKARKARHLSYMKRNIHNIEGFDALFENKYLRTFLPLGDCLLEYINFENPEVLQTMQYLRVLSLSEYSITKLPHSLGNLKHLRYLDLSSTDVKEIPYSVCTLYNLQTLLLESCRNLTELPDSIGNLKHLRYLDLSWTHIKEIPDAICSLYNLHTLLLSFCAYITWLPANMVNLINLRHVVIEGTSLKEMPMQMSKLKDLQTLSDFIVGKESGCNIKELKDLQDLRGSLCISRLQNVVNVEDVSKASLKDKKYLNQLSLKWEHDNDDAPQLTEVLDKLQPHTNLEKLYIEDYGGSSFPNWVGHHSFSRLVEVELGDCKNCYWLPTLGQLPSLTTLRIAGLDMVERIGDEFYCNGSSFRTKPFKSLEILSFSNMSQWKEWSQFEGDEEDGVFSHLKELSLGYCPKLNGACLPDYLPSVTNLYISGCHQLLASLASVRYPSLGFLRIYDCPELESIPKWGLPSNIHKISIHRCEKLESLLKAGWPPNLKSLEIFQCEKLFANCMQWNLETLTSLTSLKISEIDAVLNSFPEEGQLPTNLTFLELNSLRNLKSLNGKALQQLISLKELRIYWCHQLQCIPEEGLPISLSQLDINQCGFLNRRCQRDAGEDWPKIAHISRIQIDDEAI